MDMAKLVASWSKDTNSKVGAVVVDKDKIVLSMGYNGFPRGCDDTIEERFERPHKYLFTEHAERNALFHAARHGMSLKGCIIYCTHFPCADCARGIIQTGIVELIVIDHPDLTHHIWGGSWSASLKMFKESNINIVYLGS